MMARDGRGRRWALHPGVLGDDCRLGAPWLRARSLHLPWRQASHQRLPRRLVTPPPCPVQSRPARTIRRLPDPPLLAWLVAVVSPLLQPQDEGVSGGHWRRLVRLGNGAEPVAHGLPRDLEEAREAVHGDATQRPRDRVALHRARLPAWSRAGNLTAARLAALGGCPGDRAVGDEPITLALGTYLPRRPPPQTWASRSGGGV